MTLSTAVTKKLFFTSITLACIYITFSLACDPLAFRLVKIGAMTFGGGIFIYPALYTLLDMLTRLNGRMTTIILIIIFHCCDLLFSYMLYLINLLPAPASFQNLSAFNVVLSPLPRLFWAGILGAIIAGIVEVLIFAFLQKRFKSFIFSSFFSTLIVIAFHDIPTDITAYMKIFPTRYLTITFDNFLVVTITLAAYTVIGALALQIIERKKLKSTPN